MQFLLQILNNKISDLYKNKMTVSEAIQQSIEVAHLRNQYKPIYHKIGVGNIVGFLIFISYFTVLPAILKMIWPYLVSKFNVITIYVGSVFAINIGIFIIYNSVLYVIYQLKHPFFQQYKNTNKQWPWQQNLQAWKQLRLKSFKMIFFNFFVVTPVITYIGALRSLPYQFSIEKWPSLFELVWQFAIFFVVQDILFYFSHKLLHEPNWYWIHKYHHQYKQTISLAAHYLHPIQYVIGGMMPSSLGFQLLGFITNVHYSTILVWVIYRVIHGYQVHCGYTWTWNTLSLFPCTVGSDFHEFHHTMNAGNYGSIFIFWDALFKTQAHYIAYLKKKIEEQCSNQNPQNNKKQKQSYQNKYTVKSNQKSKYIFADLLSHQFLKQFDKPSTDNLQQSNESKQRQRQTQ